MQPRLCPCCNEKISLKVFLHNVFFATTEISFIENDKGFLCPKCKKPILCAEKKEKQLRALVGIAFVPIGLFAMVGNISLSIEYFLNIIIILSISLLIVITLVIRKYHKIDFICNDKSSDDYNDHRIQG